MSMKKPTKVYYAIECYYWLPDSDTRRLLWSRRYIRARGEKGKLVEEILGEGHGRIDEILGEGR